MSAPVELGPVFPDGTYLIEGVVGSGGMAVVYRARDIRRNRIVAVKVLRPEVSEYIGRERFQREIAVASAFSHPHILPLLDSGTLTDAQGRESPYYVMPLVDGESLRELMERERRLPLRDALQIAREVLEAVRYAHEHGVIHRDIKPANILLSSGHAIVADFGVARPLPGNLANNEAPERLTSSGYAIGTPIYMSPEQALGDSRVDIRTDLYSTAAVLYEMLVGATPFDAPTMQAMIARKVSGVFVPASAMRTGLPLALDRVLSVALSAEPSDRYASAAAFLSALDQIDSNTPANSQAIAPQKPGASLRRVLVGLGAAAAVAVGVRMIWPNSGTSTPAVLPNSARIAVLPFELMSPDSTLGIVANGFTSDLIDELAQFPALTVISKNGIAPYQNGKVPLDSIARTLHVGSIVAGDLRRVGDSVKLSVRLVDGATSQQLSKADVVGSMRDVLAMRSTMIDSVTQFLRKTIGQSVRTHAQQETKSSEAWNLLASVGTLLDTQLQNSASLPVSQRDALFASADSMLVQSAKLDESWAAPIDMQSNLRLLHADLETDSASVARLRAQAIMLASNALERWHTDGNAFAFRGRARFDLWRNAHPVAPDSLLALAESDLRSAVRNRPDLAAAWRDLSALLQQSGSFAESNQAAEMALKADAFLQNNQAVVSRLIFTSLSTGDTLTAQKWCATGIKRFPQDPRFLGCEFTILGWTGSKREDISKAWKMLATTEQRDSANALAWGRAQSYMMIAAIAARAGLADSAKAIMASAYATASDPRQVALAKFGEARVQSLLGNEDAALSILEGYLQRNPSLRKQVRVHPWFALLKNNANFARITSPQ